MLQLLFIVTHIFNENENPVIIILGEPKKWEQCLQLLVDLLLTSGKPVHSAQRAARQTLPVIVCSTDMQFMHKAAFPRYVPSLLVSLSIQ